MLLQCPCLLQSLETSSSLWLQHWHSWTLHSLNSAHFLLSRYSSPLVLFLALGPLFPFFSFLCWFLFLWPNIKCYLNFQLCLLFFSSAFHITLTDFTQSLGVNSSIFSTNSTSSLILLSEHRNKLPTNLWPAPAGRPEASQTIHIKIKLSPSL